MDEVDRRIVNALQGGFPLSERPFQEAGKRLGLSEEALIERLRKLLEEGILTRFGPLYHAERLGGAFCLCAMAVPEERFEEVAEIVNAFPEVAHNYARDHKLNMWFVLATETPEGIGEAMGSIERETGLPIHAFPKIEEFFVELKLLA